MRCFAVFYDVFICSNGVCVCAFVLCLRPPVCVRVGLCARLLECVPALLFACQCSVNHLALGCCPPAIASQGSHNFPALGCCPPSCFPGGLAPLHVVLCLRQFLYAPPPGLFSILSWFIFRAGTLAPSDPMQNFEFLGCVNGHILQFCG